MNDENKTVLKSYQISYLKPMDWPRLEAFGGERIPISEGNLPERVFGFFFSRWCEKSNRKSSEVQSVLAGDFRRREDSEIREESAGASVRFFFPGGAKSLIANRVRFSQCWLEAFGGERIPRSGRNLAGANVRFFFLPMVRKV